MQRYRLFAMTREDRKEMKEVLPYIFLVVLVSVLIIIMFARIAKAQVNDAIQNLEPRIIYIYPEPELVIEQEEETEPISKGE